MGRGRAILLSAAAAVVIGGTLGFALGVSDFASS
jgi:hypothetical protein